MSSLWERFLRERRAIKLRIANRSLLSGLRLYANFINHAENVLEQLESNCFRTFFTKEKNGNSIKITVLLWSKRTIETILANKKYIGTSEIYKTFQNGYPQPKRVSNRGAHEVYEIQDHHIPIIPKEIFDKAQETRAERSNIETDEEGNVHRKAKKYSSTAVDFREEKRHNSENSLIRTDDQVD